MFKGLKGLSRLESTFCTTIDLIIVVPQEAILEKESIETQLAHVRGKRDTVNQQQHAFQLQLNEVRKSIEEFEERRTTYVVRMF